MKKVFMPVNTPLQPLSTGILLAALPICFPLLMRPILAENPFRAICRENMLEWVLGLLWKQNLVSSV